MVASQTIARNAERAQSKRCTGKVESRARPSDSIEAGIIHLASLQGGSLILREDCYNVVT
jgi:hypothetical protein